MINKIIKKIYYKLNGISNEQLTLDANISAGMKVGKNCSGLIGCTLDYGHCWLIEIGDNVVFAPQVYLLAHDTSTKRSLNYTRIGKIKIGNNIQSLLHIKYFILCRQRSISGRRSRQG